MGLFARLFGPKKAPPHGPPPYPYGMLPETPGGQYAPAPNFATPGIYNANDYPGAWPMGIPNVDSRGHLVNTGQYQPLPKSLASQVAASKRTRYRQFSGHAFVHARMPDPGAPAWTFDSLGLVEFSPVGTGIVNRGEIKALEGAPYFPNLMVVTQGLGGIVQGEVVLQPLMADPLSTAELQVG